MSRYNQGMITTNEKCIGCNKCVLVCPVNGANVSIVENNKPSIAVAAKKCINCGECIGACNHGARNYKDDTEAFFAAINQGKKISILVDPTFTLAYFDTYPMIYGYLKSLGVDRIYDSAIGSEISAWAHLRYLREHENDPDKAFITNSCAATTRYIEQYEPNMIKLLIPVHSPSISSAIYARKYQNDTNEIAYISPCPAIREAFAENGNLVNYNVCFENLLKHIEGVDISGFYAEADYKSQGLGELETLETGFSYLLEPFIGREKTLTHNFGLDKDLFERIDLLANTEGARPYIAEVTSCAQGCFSGAGVRVNKEDYAKISASIQAKKNVLTDSIRGTGSIDENYKILEEHMSSYNFDDFKREYHSKFRQMAVIDEATVNDIYKAMYKTTEVKKKIDCGSCGYKTCREMVDAIACGYNKMENCIHYMNDELLMRYYTDHLTKIPNSEGFKKEVANLYTSNIEKTYVIGVVSINRLNLINDLHGFSLGDEVIKKAAEIAVAFTTVFDGVAGRMGGGEFLLCFEYNQDALDRIHTAITYSFADIGVSFPLSFRAGLYIDEDRSESIESMINFASLARDRIEEDGVSTCLYYNEELKERLAAEAMVTSQMVTAVENNEFVAYFQPQYCHRNRKIVGAETLCRWVKKDGSVIAPGLFIPIFEKNGFIKTLDKYMWELAFKAVMKWTELGYKPIPISVNISRVSLDQKDFTDIINKLFVKYPIDPSLLHFEITESAYSDRQDVVAKKINSLRTLGFEVAMDDFGSGYSSLNVLKDMPLDILKLDMGFLRGRNQERGESILRNVVAMVKELDLDIVSEGVETMEQAEFLRHVGCDIIQGYLYAKPMPQEEYENLIRVN